VAEDARREGKVSYVGYGCCGCCVCRVCGCIGRRWGLEGRGHEMRKGL